MGLRTPEGPLLGTSHNRAAFLYGRDIKSGGFECNGVKNVFIDGVRNVFIDYSIAGQPRV
jgi:hypothetical protein